MNSQDMAHKDEANRLVLGTAQLGMPYGIANRSGQPDASQARAIVEAAWEAGIRTLILPGPMVRVSWFWGGPWQS